MVRPHCPPEPFNVVLVLLGYAADGSRVERISEQYTKAAIDALAMSANPNVRVGVVYVRAKATILLELTNNEGNVPGARAKLIVLTLVLYQATYPVNRTDSHRRRGCSTRRIEGRA